MRELKIGKVVVHTSIGESGEPLNRAMTVIEQLTGGKPSIRRAKQTIRTFGIRKYEPISCLVTLRGRNAEEFVGRALAAVGNFVSSRSFDQLGNFAFGIKEHIDMSGTRYDPNLGIIGMDVMVCVERPGYRVKRKRKARSKIGRAHRVVREDAIDFIRNRFGTEVGLRSE
jgi:large subunit ribosomal protein L5